LRNPTPRRKEAKTQAKAGGINCGSRGIRGNWRARRAFARIAGAAGRSNLVALGKAYDSPAPDAFDALIAEGIASEHFQLTDAFREGVRVRGRKSARKAVVK
jgi:hypothetical protein